MPEAAWIRTVDEQKASGEVAAAYAQATSPATGQVANILKVHSLNPRSLLAHRTLYRTLMFGPSPLQRYQREMIAVVVSALNGCHYWLVHHGEALRRLLQDQTLYAQIREDYTQAELSPADRTMLDYATKLTLRPAAVTRGDVQALGEAGFDDRAILDIAQITAYFAFVNRTADGLGVALEDD
jgi:uncharacterized peroxidase-related enzyme